MKILLVSATTFEIAPLIKHLEENWQKASFFEYKNDSHSLTPLVTGVGPVNTALQLGRYQAIKDFDIAINVGICGCYHSEWPLGSVVEIVKDRMGDIGVEEADGTFVDIHELDLDNPNMFPYHDGWITNEKRPKESGLKRASGLTVSTVGGTQATTQMRKSKYNADVETMETAAFFLNCKSADIPFISVRGISNVVGPRDRSSWKIAEAIDNVNTEVINYIKELL